MRTYAVDLLPCPFCNGPLILADVVLAASRKVERGVLYDDCAPTQS